MGGTKFRLDLNLRNLSLISIAAKLWDSQDIKNRIKNNFSRRYREFQDWSEISKLVVQSANFINLPPRLLVLLKKTILIIGQKIHDWIYYVTKILKLHLIYTQKIYFSFGAVDEIKIFDLYWRDLMARDDFIYQSDYFRHSPLFSLACMYGCDRFVKERKNEMLDELSVFCPEVKEGDEIYNIMSVSIWMTARKSKLRNVCSPQEMFEVCLEAGFSKTARFYWEKLDEVDKVSNLAYFAKKCWQQYNDGFVLEKCCENLLFLINQMGEEEKSLFFAEYADQIIRLFLPVWPYQELIVNLLKYDWIVESSRLLKMAEILFWFSEGLNPSELALDNELLFQIVQKVWGNIPVDEKLRFLRKNCGTIISSLSLPLHMELLNLLFNDRSIMVVDGEKMDSFITDGLLLLVNTGKYDILNALIETIFYFIPEPKEVLKENLSHPRFVRDLIQNDTSFGLVDQFLNWLTESEAERARLKNKINTIFICRSLTEGDNRWVNRFEVADKFLKWRLETDAGVKRFKDEMKSYNFVLLECLGYVRIKSGDLTWLRPGDSLAMHPDEYPFDSADGLTFLKFEDATELNRGVVLGVKLFYPGLEYILGPYDCYATTSGVSYVGTEVGDFILFNVREIWKKGLCESDFELVDVVDSSNAFIKFYYETDEEVLEFKKTKLDVLVSENLVEFLHYALESSSDFPDYFLGDFCKFCMIPSEKIEEIKIQKRSDIKKVLNDHRFRQNRFDVYLNRLFGKI